MARRHRWAKSKSNNSNPVVIDIAKSYALQTIKNVDIAEDIKDSFARILCQTYLEHSSSLSYTYRFSLKKEWLNSYLGTGKGSFSSILDKRNKDAGTDYVTVICSGHEHKLVLKDTTWTFPDHPGVYTELLATRIAEGVVDIRQNTMDEMPSCACYCRLNTDYENVWDGYYLNYRADCNNGPYKRSLLSAYQTRINRKLKQRKHNFAADVVLPVEWNIAQKIVPVLLEQSKDYKEYLATTRKLYIYGTTIETAVTIIPDKNFTGYGYYNGSNTLQLFTPIEWYTKLFKKGFPTVVNGSFLLSRVAQLTKTKWLVVCTKDTGRDKVVTSLGVLEKGPNKWVLTHTPSRNTYQKWTIKTEASEFYKEVTA